MIHCDSKQSESIFNQNYYKNAMANNCKQCFNTHYQPHYHPTTKSLWLCSSVYCRPPHQSLRIWLAAEAANQPGRIFLIFRPSGRLNKILPPSGRSSSICACAQVIRMAHSGWRSSCCVADALLSILQFWWFHLLFLLRVQCLLRICCCIRSFLSSFLFWCSPVA